MFSVCHFNGSGRNRSSIVGSSSINVYHYEYRNTFVRTLCRNFNPLDTIARLRGRANSRERDRTVDGARFTVLAAPNVPAERKTIFAVLLAILRLDRRSAQVYVFAVDPRRPGNSYQTPRLLHAAAPAACRQLGGAQ